MGLAISKYDRLIRRFPHDEKFPFVTKLPKGFILLEETGELNDEELVLWSIELDASSQHLAEKSGEIAQWVKQHSEKPVIWTARTENNNHLIFYGISKDQQNIRQLSKQNSFSERFGITVRDVEVINGAALYASVTDGDSETEGFCRFDLMVTPSPNFTPVLPLGISIDKDLNAAFMLDPGSANLRTSDFHKESQKVINYVGAGLLIPQESLWVNLSPYESKRMIPEVLSKTEMGRDMLEQDYLFKRFIASLLHPEGKIGKAYWDKVYSQAEQKYGWSNRPISFFPKAWIEQAKATIFVPKNLENITNPCLVESYKRYGNLCCVSESKLKVLCEVDSFALKPNQAQPQPINSLCLRIFKEMILPIVEREINEGKIFSKIRQITHSLILAAWAKKKLKNNEKLKNIIDTCKPEKFHITVGMPRTSPIKKKGEISSDSENSVVHVKHEDWKADIEKLEEIFGEDYPLTLAIKSNMAISFREDGKLQPALNLLMQVLEDEIKTLGEDHPKTLETQNQIAITLRKKEEFQDALKIHDRLLEVQGRKLGKEHPNTLFSLIHKGITLRENGSLEDALEIHYQVLDKRCLILSHEHPDILESILELGITLRKLGEQRQAQELHNEFLNTKKRLLYEENSRTTPFHQEGFLVKLKKIFTFNVKHLISSRITQDTSTLSCQSKPYLLISEELKTAQELHEKVIQTRTQSLGENHPDTLDAMHILADTLIAQGKWIKANKIKEKIQRLEKNTDELSSLEKETDFNKTVYEKYLEVFRSGIYKCVQHDWNGGDELITKVFFTGSIHLGEIPMEVTNKLPNGFQASLKLISLDKIN